nr:F0F1 ATP synthase subunit epsilon [Pseudactinotalea sp. HY160]
MSVEVVATDRTVWAGEASAITAPASEGSIGILPGHQPVLAVLRPGTVLVTPTGGEKVELEVGGGFVSVDHDIVTIVIDATVESGTDAD